MPPKRRFRSRVRGYVTCVGRFSSPAAGLAMGAACVFLAGCGSSSGNSSMAAGSDWPTNGGATSNQRYSTLDQIDTSNVSQLKGVWHTHLNGVAMAAKYSG